MVVDATSTPAYVRAGRGGAGNFKDAAVAAASIQREREEAQRTKAAVAASITKPRVGLGGRGGAGNWTTNEPHAAAQREEEQKLVEDLELKVLRDVEAGLAMPAPAYRQAERERT